MNLNYEGINTLTLEVAGFTVSEILLDAQRQAARYFQCDPGQVVVMGFNASPWVVSGAGPLTFQAQVTTWREP